MTITAPARRRDWCLRAQVQVIIDLAKRTGDKATSAMLLFELGLTTETAARVLR